MIRKSRNSKINELLSVVINVFKKALYEKLLGLY